MADHLEVLPPDSDEEAGGPVKTFLEHLEDLRWTLIKCAVALALGVFAAVSASPYITKALEWPLRIARTVKLTAEPKVILTLGTNVLGRMPLADFPVTSTSTNADVHLKVSAVTIGTNQILALVPDPTPPRSATDEYDVLLKTFGPLEPFAVVIKIALYGGAAISAPFILLFLGQFILPALHVHEKRFLYRIVGFGSLLFFSGVAFCYLVLLVVALSSTVGFSNWLGFAADEWRAAEYFGFVCWFLLGMGIAFQLPMVLLTLVRIGLTDSTRLRAMRMYVVVAILVLSGFVTPDGNPLTMVLMALPLQFLFELSVLIAAWWERQDRRREALAATAPRA